MKKTRLDGLHYWSVYQPDRQIDFNGFFWQRPEGNLMIDPMPLDDAALALVDEMGGVQSILISNADHSRASFDLKERFGSRVLAPAGDRERFAETAAGVDTWFENAEELPPGIGVHWIHGGKSPVEPCFALEALNAIVFADVVRSHVSGSLMILPPAKLQDRDQVVRSLEFLRTATFDAILLGDGDCLFGGAQEALGELMRGL